MQVLFLCCLILYWSSTQVYAAKEDMDGIRKQAVEVFARLDQMDNFVESLSLADMNVFPVGMKRTVSNVNYALAISSIQFFRSTQNWLYGEEQLFRKVKKAIRYCFSVLRGSNYRTKGILSGMPGWYCLGILPSRLITELLLWC